MLGVRSYEPAMNRLPMPHKRPKYRRPTTPPALLPMPPEYWRYYAQYLAEWHIYYSRCRYRSKLSKQRNRSLRSLQYMRKYSTQDPHYKVRPREFAYNYAHIAVLDSRN